MNKLYYALSISLFLASPCWAKVFPTPRKILFGACADQSLPQPIWDAMSREKADVFLFLGDVIYADTEDMSVMKKKYELFAQNPGFKRFREHTPIIAIYDDHDLGRNDAGGDYPKKEESRKQFLDFFKESRLSPRRHRDGVYGAYEYGVKEHKLQVIMLDTRWNRTLPLKIQDPVLIAERMKKTIGPYEPNFDKNASMLGEKQWLWLAEQLKKPAELSIIASGIPILAEFTGFETWSNFPHEKQRLFELIKASPSKHIILISGDIHKAEFSKLNGVLAYPLWEATSSGLTHAGTHLPPNIHRDGNLILSINYASIELSFTPKLNLKVDVKDGHGQVLRSQKIF